MWKRFVTAIVLVCVLLIIFTPNPIGKCVWVCIKMSRLQFLRRVKSDKIIYMIITSESREAFADEFATLLNKPVELWPAVFTKPCPVQNASIRPNERGLLLAHRAVWERIVASKSDIGVIFEDDSWPSTPESLTLMHNELKNMKGDILYLGWCNNVVDVNYIPPQCAHAYAITRRAAKHLLQNFDQCDMAVDNVISGSNLEWSLANIPRDAPVHWTQGLFIQRDTNGSLQ